MTFARSRHTRSTEMVNGPQLAVESSGVRDPPRLGVSCTARRSGDGAAVSARRRSDVTGRVPQGEVGMSLRSEG